MRSITSFALAASAFVSSALATNVSGQPLNTVRIHNAGKIGQSIVWESNAGQCRPYNQIDFIPAGETLVKTDSIFQEPCSCTGPGCVPIEWAGRFRAIPGDSKFQGSHFDALHKAQMDSSVIAEICFNAFAGETFYDASRVDVGCNVQKTGVKWMYPTGDNRPASQSGCGWDGGACWNLYVWDTNDIMQLSTKINDITVILGDEDFTHCSADDPGAICCTEVEGCAPAGKNPAWEVYGCPIKSVAQDMWDQINGIFDHVGGGKGDNQPKPPKIDSPIPSPPVPTDLAVPGAVFHEKEDEEEEVVTVVEWVTEVVYTTVTVCPEGPDCSATALPESSAPLIKRSPDHMAHALHHQKHARGLPAHHH